MAEREKLIKRYFESWVKNDISSLEEVFDNSIIYSECYGPEYRGLKQVKQWFEDWNKKGKVIRWDIKSFIHDNNVTTVEWFFQCKYNDEISSFDGVSLIVFNGNGKIISLKEFQSKYEHNYPYGV